MDACRHPKPRRQPASALLGALAGCGLSALALPATPPASAQSPAELHTYQQRLERLFQRLDQNNDRRLERLEVDGVPYLERHFERLDQQQRGFLTPDDLLPAAAAPGQPRGGRVFSRADRNGDGRIERTEAAAFPWLLKRFDAADRDGDGTLSREELRRSRGRRGQGQP